MREKRHAVGKHIFNRWIETNSVYNVNTVFQSISSGRLTYMTDTAYAALADSTGVTVNTSAGATVDNIITTLNNTARAILKANSKKGFTLSKNTQLLVYYSYEHGDLMDQVIERRLNTTGQVDRLRKRFNFAFIETWNDNFPAQLESSKNGAMVVLPRLKNIWGTFKGLRQETKNMFGTDSTCVKAQEYWNHQEPAAQRQIARLEA